MRVWSERDGRADIAVHGFSLIDNIIALAAGLIVVGAAVLVVGGLV